MQVRRLVIANLASHLIDQWDDHYPTRHHLEQDLNCGGLVAIAPDEMLLGFIALNTDQEPQYARGQWHGIYPAILHRLMVRPCAQHSGIGSALVLRAEHQAIRQGRDSVRLDAFIHNPAAMRLYQRLGYVHRGMVHFRKGPFALFEKILATVPTSTLNRQSIAPGTETA